MKGDEKMIIQSIVCVCVCVRSRLKYSLDFLCVLLSPFHGMQLQLKRKIKETKTKQQQEKPRGTILHSMFVFYFKYYVVALLSPQKHSL